VKLEYEKKEESFGEEVIRDMAIFLKSKNRLSRLSCMFCNGKDTIRS